MIYNFLVHVVIFVFGACATGLIALYIYFQKKFKYWDERNVPHAQPSFPLGNLSTKESLAVVFKKLYEESKHERYYGIWQLHRPTIMVNDPDLIKQILVSDFMSFHDRGVYYNEKNDPLSVKNRKDVPIPKWRYVIFAYMGSIEDSENYNARTANIAALEGSSWKNLRAKLTPTFTSGKIKMMFPIIVKCGEEMLEVAESLAKMEDVLNVKDLTERFTTDTISLCAFGIEANSLKDPNSIIKKMGSKVLEPTRMNVIRKAVSFFMPDLGELFKLNLNSKHVSDFFLKMFRDTMDYREKNNVKRNDVMDLLIQLKNKGFIDEADSHNKPKESGKIDQFTFEQAAAQAFVYFVGGFETTSATMQFTLYELAMNQKIQTKVREEIKNVLAKHNGKLTYEAVMNEMEYLGRVIDETLRKYLPGFILLRKCNKDFKVAASDLIIEKGMRIVIPILAIHMDERYHPNPDKFDPDRFTEELKLSRQSFTYLPFGEGPRVCIGQRFALMQTKVGIISLLSKYKFDVSPGRTPNPIEFDPKSIQLAPKGGMHLKISKEN